MMNGWGWVVKLLRRFTSWNHITDDSSVSFGIAINNNKQAKQRQIPDANQWSYTSLLKQNGMSDATQWTYNWILTYNKQAQAKSKEDMSDQWNGLTLYPFQIIGSKANQHGLTIVLNGKTSMSQGQMKWSYTNGKQRW